VIFLSATGDERTASLALSPTLSVRRWHECRSPQSVTRASSKDRCQAKSVVERKMERERNTGLSCSISPTSIANSLKYFRFQKSFFIITTRELDGTTPANEGSRFESMVPCYNLYAGVVASITAPTYYWNSAPLSSSFGVACLPDD